MIKPLIVAAVVLALVPAVAAAEPARHVGLTVEANLGGGMLHIGDPYGDQTDAAIGGLDVGVGAFFTPRIAFTLRAAGVTHLGDGYQVTQVFLGPSFQFWANDQVWFGAGLGIGIAHYQNDGASGHNDTGVGFDARLGYTFNPGARHAFNLSAELTPSLIKPLTVTGVAILVGYQLQ